MLKRMKIVLILAGFAFAWPLAASAQTSCLTDDFTTNQVENTCSIDAVTPNGAWPRDLTAADCGISGTPFGDPSDCRSCGGNVDCKAWEFDVQCSENQDHVVLWVSADVPTLGASPGPSPTFFNVGEGDNKGNMENGPSVYGVRVNNNNDADNPTLITPTASPVPGQAGVHLNKISESCAFSMPGDLLNPFQPLQPVTTFEFKGCGVGFSNGQGQINSGNCKFLNEDGSIGGASSDGLPVSAVEVAVGNANLGAARFLSEGQTGGFGGESCSTFVFFEQVYVVVLEPIASPDCPCEEELPCGDGI